MSTLYVDTITEKTVGNGVQIPGHVIQVVQGVYTANAQSPLAPSLTQEFLSQSLLKIHPVKCWY